MIENLPFVKYANRDQLPAVAGVYFAVTDQVDYIGESDNLRRRWRNHEVIERMAMPPIIYFQVMPGISKVERCQFEQNQIARFQPPLNRSKSAIKMPRFTVKNPNLFRSIFIERGCIRQKQIAEALFVSENTVLQWLKGRPMHKRQAARIAAYLEKPVGDLFAEETERVEAL